MDVIKRLRIDKSKQDDLAYGVLGVFSIGLLLTKSIVVATIITILFVIAYTAYLNRDTLSEYFKKEEPEEEVLPVQEEISEKEEKPKKEKEDYSNKVILGKTEAGKSVALTMDELGHMFIAGMTRYGKTRLLHALVAEFTKFDADELRIAFSDAKGVSFNLFSRSSHLYSPIAISKEETEILIANILEEMYRRLDLFKEYANDDLCTNIDEYKALSEEKLPRLVIMFDELADSVEPDSEAEKNLTTLAKMGLAAGIHLVLSTQRPTKQGITHEVQTQCQTVMSTYMKNRAEYGTITKIPQSIYQFMKPVKGLFMIFSPELAPFFMDIEEKYEGWGFIRSNYYDNEAIKEVAQKDRGERQDLVPLTVVKLPSWEGSQDDKFAAMKLLEEKLNRDLEVTDMCTSFNISSRTAKDWLEKYYG